MAAYTEKPPILTGDNTKDVAALRDFLFRLAGSLEQAAGAPSNQGAVQISTRGDGQQVAKQGDRTAEQVRKTAQELKDLILKEAREVIQYADSKTEEYQSLFVAKSEYGEFTETIESRIETGARGVVESYNYNELIESAQDSIDLLQEYMTSIQGEIRRGIVMDPDTGYPVTGIAISQNLQFTGQISQGEDGHEYYYLTDGQTFGLYTSTGWQFWIDGHKVGWFSSLDGILHVKKVTVEESLQLSDKWQISLTGDVLEFVYMEAT